MQEANIQDGSAQPLVKGEKNMELGSGEDGVRRGKLLDQLLDQSGYGCFHVFLLIGKTTLNILILQYFSVWCCLGIRFCGSLKCLICNSSLR